MDENYIKHQAKRALKTNSPAAKENFLWRILSNSDGATRWLVKTA